MSHTCLDLPELNATSSLLRIPPELDVPVTDRVLAVLDTVAMQRLRKISQLGLVSMVYPGAVHSRFEHSLGVYRLACQVLRQLAHSESEVVSCLPETEVKIFLLASLLHDVGHWPYCHPIEDMQLPEVPSHESSARRWLQEQSLASIIQERWNVDPQSVADFLAVKSNDRSRMLLQNILSGPVDIDKMDYLQRDSYHAGVPYGRNFDSSRLLNSLRFGSARSMAITSKGKTAAEMMVFSRYVMFSEVYWHHGVRSATAMLQRAVYRLRHRLNFTDWSDLTEAEFQNMLLDKASLEPSIRPVCEGLFGRKRRLYKRYAQFSFNNSPQVHSRLARRSYTDLVQIAESLAHRLSSLTKLPIGPDDVLIDAPPVKLEIQFRLDVLSDGQLKPLADLSPVVHALATDQFDNFVKTVRVFVAPHLREPLLIPQQQFAECLMDCIL